MTDPSPKSVADPRQAREPGRMQGPESPSPAGEQQSWSAERTWSDDRLWSRDPAWADDGAWPEGQESPEEQAWPEGQEWPEEQTWAGEYEPPDGSAPAASDDPEPGQRERSGRWPLLIALGALALMMVLAAGALVWWAKSRPHATLAAPDTVAGLHLDTSADAKQTADYLRAGVAAYVSLESSIGAVYDDPASKDRSVMFFGGTAGIASPGRQLDTVLAALLDDQGGGVTGMRAVPAGELGGVMRCGTSTGDGGPLTVCGWADRGSIGLALFPGRSVDDAAPLMLALRNGIQKG